MLVEPVEAMGVVEWFKKHKFDPKVKAGVKWWGHMEKTTLSVFHILGPHELKYTQQTESFWSSKYTKEKKT